VLKAWERNGVLTEEIYAAPNRHPRTRVVLNEARITEMMVPIRTFDE
jgi:hypothetical protein